MTGFVARVDGEPVSLLSFQLPSTFARVNEQQVSLKIVYCLLTCSISRNENNENIRMERSGLE